MTLSKLWGIISLLSAFYFLQLPIILGHGKVDPCWECRKCNDCKPHCINCTYYCTEEFTITRSCAVAMMIGAGIAVPFATSVLGILGFTAAGVTSGSLAALWQSTMAGVVAKGSIFSILQSIGAAGFSYSGAAVVIGAAGAAMCNFCGSLGNMTRMDLKCSSQINCD